MERVKLLDEIEDFIYVSDMQTHEILYINQRAREILGISDDYKGRKCYDILQGRSEPCPFCTNDIITRNKYYIWQHSNQHLKKDFIVKDKIIEWEGREVRFELALDVSDSLTPALPQTILEANKIILEQQKLLQSQISFLSQLYASLPCGVVQFPVEDPTRLLDYNNACWKIFRYTSREDFDKIAKNSIMEVVHKEDQDIFLRVLNKVVRTGKRAECEFRILRADGTVGWNSEIVEMVQSASGKTVIQDVFWDISEEREKEIRINALAEQLPIALGIYEVGETPHLTYISEGCSKITGYTVEEYKELTKEQVEACIHPQDKERFLSSMQNVIRNKGKEEDEFRLIRKDGQVIWISVKSTRVKEENNKFIYYVVYSDIDLLKKSQIEAETQREKYEKEAKQNKMQYQREIQYIAGISKDVLSTAKVNLTQNKVEDYRPNAEPYVNSYPFQINYQNVLKKIMKTVVNEEERKEIVKKIAREQLLTDFERGNLDIEVDARRCFVSGSLVWVRTHVKLMREPETEDIIGFIVEKDIDKDMTELFSSRKLLEHMQIVSNEKYFFVMSLDYSNDTYDIIQCKQRIRSAMPVCGKINDLVKEMYTFYDEKAFAFLDILKEEALLKKKFEDGRTEWIYEGKSQNGATYNWYEHLLIPVTSKDTGEVIYLFATTNINERKNREEELNKALLRAEKAGRAKQEFLSHMSHEIRTPLNGIRGMLSLMKESEDTKDNKLMGNALISANHLSSLLNDLLDMSKIESGKLHLEQTIVFQKELMDSLMAMMKLMADEKGIELICNLVNPHYQAFYADEKRLKQILINILSNAIKYTNNGGRITFDILVEEVKKKNLRLQFMIKDNGIGMEEALLNKIYLPFEQGTAAVGQEGTGLGLAITKKLVEMMGGDIKLDSKVGVGTKVTVTLQAIGTNEGEAPQDAYLFQNRQSYFEHMDFQGKRALVVEDNEINMQIASMQLENIGLLVDMAYDGDAAVSKVRDAAEGYYDIIFMDVMMPKKDGLAATKEIRQLQGRKDVKRIPIVAMTANAFAEDIHRSLESGMNYHLSKPFERIDVMWILAKEFLNQPHPPSKPII